MIPMETTDTDKPTGVPENFEKADASRCGYAVSDGDLWVSKDEFIIVLGRGARSAAGSAGIIMEAARACPDVPTSLGEAVDGTVFRGDLTDLDATVTALKYYEDYEAGIGEDKWAYELRTMFNHARLVVKDSIEEDVTQGRTI